MKNKKIVAYSVLIVILVVLSGWVFRLFYESSDVFIKRGSTLIVKEGVTEISANDLKCIGSIKRVQLPSSLKRIGDYAFSDFDELSAITIPEGVVSIGRGAFSSCDGLTYVQLPNSLDSIGIMAFMFCRKLRTLKIPPSVSSIGGDALGFTAINQIVCYDNGRKCYGWAGVDCDMPSVVVVPEGVVSIDDEAFSGGENLQTVVFPSTLREIGLSSFFSCRNLKEIKGLEYVTSIEKLAFDECLQLNRLLCYDKGRKCYGWAGSDALFPQKMVIPEGVVSIDNGAFYSNKRLHEVEFPKSLKKIGLGAFEECRALGKVTLPEGLESVESYAFDSDIEIANIPKSLTSIGNNAFKLPSGLLLYANGTKCYGWVGKKDSCPAVVTIPKGVKYLNPGAFAGCSNLQQIQIPEGVTAIPPSAFDGCDKLTELELPNSIDTIGSYSLRCSSLVNIKGLSKVRCIDRDVFDDNKKGLLIYDDGRKCYGWLGDEACPDTIVLPQGVISIDSFAFKDCFSLKVVVLPQGLQSIGKDAFRYCERLSKIEFPQSLKSIGDGAFLLCYYLNGVNLPDSLKSIGDEAFQGCTSISEINLPSTLTSLGNGAFRGCAMKSITIPEGIGVLGENLFSGCDELKRVEIPSTVTLIGDNAFSKCPKLSSIQVPNSVTSIGKEAFEGCGALSSVVLSDSVKVIKNATFSGCRTLKEIHLPALLGEVEAYAFDDCPKIEKRIAPNVNVHRDAFGMSWRTRFSSWKEEYGDSVLTLVCVCALLFVLRKCFSWRKILIGSLILLVVVAVIIAIVYAISIYELCSGGRLHG
ncbi:MAG: leucine-rich repeat domain-containing protein [Paludibacteraceae bacterium]|nr:leucine-rich repeat domain-containing protein [Paludibacteraceae bacterium]